MKPFVFQVPTRVVFAPGLARDLGRETATMAERVLLLYGRQSAQRLGTLSLARESLARAGVRVVEHGGVRPNPEVEHVRQGIELVRHHRLQAVVAMGGGSVLDSGKAIAAGALVRHDVWLFFKGKKSIRQTLPLLCLPTLAGSGSELSNGMVLGNRKSGQKLATGNRFLYPRLALLDPLLTCTAPPAQTAYGAVDALSHLLEAYCSADSLPPLQARLMESLARTIIKDAEQAVARPDHLQARANLLWASGLALQGFSRSGLGRTGFAMHLIEHAISGHYDTPHGAGLAVLLLPWLRAQARGRAERLARFSCGVWEGMTTRAGGASGQAREGIQRLGRWLQRLGCPTSLAALGIAPAAVPEIADRAACQSRRWRLPHLDQQAITAILLDQQP